MQAERLGGFRLPLRHGLNAAPPDLAEIGAGMQREGDGHRNPRIDIEAEKCHAVIDDEELHEERRALEDRDIAGGRLLQDLVFRRAGQRHEKTENATADKADDRQCHGPFQTLQQEVDFIEADRCHFARLT